MSYGYALPSAPKYGRQNPYDSPDQGYGAQGGYSDNAGYGNGGGYNSPPAAQSYGGEILRF
ncbi:hypothetical protein ACHAPQ_005406 [Fusarium lateritium]